jgi:hypothetical protein
MLQWIIRIVVVITLWVILFGPDKTSVPTTAEIAQAPARVVDVLQAIKDGDQAKLQQKGVEIEAALRAGLATIVKSLGTQNGVTGSLEGILPKIPSNTQNEPSSFLQDLFNQYKEGPTINSNENSATVTGTWVAVADVQGCFICLREDVTGRMLACSPQNAAMCSGKL